MDTNSMMKGVWSVDVMVSVFEGTESNVDKSRLYEIFFLLTLKLDFRRIEEE